MKRLTSNKAIQPVYQTTDREANPGQRPNFWEFVDSRVQSQEQIAEFCNSHGLELIKKIASGGFGSVYQAQDVVDGRKLVLKVLDFNPHQPNIKTRYWCKNNQIYVEIYVELHQTVQEILASHYLGWEISDLLPFLIEKKIIEPDLEVEVIRHYKLVEYLCGDEFLYELRRRANEYSFFGNLELWLSQKLDSQKLKNLSLFDILNLAPGLINDQSWNWQGNEANWISARDLLFSLFLPITLKDLITQSHKIFGDHGRSLLRELLWEVSPDESSWRFAWIPQDLDALNPWFSEQKFHLERLLERYSIKEIQSRWPELFQIQITRCWPAGAAIAYLQGEVKAEVKRLLAIKHETITANALQQPTLGFNPVVMPPQKIGDNLLIVSSFLYDWHTILPGHLVNVREAVGDDAPTYTLAYSSIILFLYEIGQWLLQSPWSLGDLKPGNFKMNLAGEWQLIDYGGHCLNALDKENPENLLGSNDYASYALFHLLNAPADQEWDTKLIAAAKSPNSAWFSLVKVAIRMMTSQTADYLRGGDLNRALVHDFQGYHEAIFQRLYDSMLIRQDSPCHYRKWSLVIKDVAQFFAEERNPGLEASLRRLLFIIGLSITGISAVSLLDEEMQQSMTIRYNNGTVKDTTWEIAQEANKVIITEYCKDAVKLDRQGLHPREALKLLAAFFPKISQALEEQQQQNTLQQKMLQQLHRLGVLDVARYFDPCQTKYFAAHVIESLNSYAEINWLHIEPMKAIVAQNPVKLPNFPTAHLQKLQVQLIKWLQQQQPNRSHLEGLYQLMDSLVEWQTFCFQQYLHLPPHATPEQIKKQMALFLMNRWAMVQQAWNKHQNELLEFALQSHWIEKIAETEMNWLANQMRLCDPESHVRVMLNHEIQNCLVLKNPHIATWQNLLNEYRTQLRNHPFFPTGISEQWQANDLLQQWQSSQIWRSGLSLSERDELAYWEQAALTSAKFPWADAAIAEKLLVLFAKGFQNSIQRILTGLKEADLQSIINVVPKNLAQWQEIVSNAFLMLKQVFQEPEPFIPSELYKDIALQTSPYLFQDTDKLCHLLDRCIAHFQTLQTEIHRHFLMTAMGKENLPLEYVYQKLKKLARYLSQDQELKWFSTKIQNLDSNLAQKKIGRWYAMYHHSRLILKELEPLCHRWSDYANSQGWVLSTVRQTRYSLAAQEVDDRSLWQDEAVPKNLAPLMKDQLRNRVARFLVRTGHTQIDMSYIEGQALSILWELFSQHGLLLSQEYINNYQCTTPIREVVANVYQSLRRQTGQFQNLPPSLADIKRLALVHYQELSVATIREKFARVIPDEVKEPSFSHSMLMEFLDCYWKNYRSDTPDPTAAMRKKILLMQLQREYQDLQTKYAQAKQQCAELSLTVVNLSLLRKEEEISLLLKESQEKWPIQLQIFNDYLLLSQKIIDAEKKQTGWNGFEFLRDTKNSFLQAMYPELKRPDLQKIYLAMLELKPLPELKDIREFLQKCYLFHLQQEHHTKLQEILASGQQDSVLAFDRAKQFLDVYCIPCAEEEICRVVERVPLEEDSKKQFLQSYLEVRHQMPVTKRIQRETRFLDKLHQTHPQELNRILLFELWLAKFQLVCESTIVSYFSEALDHLNQADRDKIHESLVNATNNTDIAALFHWLFEHHIFQPTLLLLDSDSIFENKASEQILNQLALKYQMQKIPTKVQWQISRTIQEKLASGILTRQQVATQILSMLETLV